MKQFVKELIAEVGSRPDLWEPLGSGFQRVVEPYPQTNGGIQCPSARIIIRISPTRVIANGIEQPLSIGDRRALRRAVRSWYRTVNLGAIQGMIPTNAISRTQ